MSAQQSNTGRNVVVIVIVIVVILLLLVCTWLFMIPCCIMGGPGIADVFSQVNSALGP